MPAVKHRKRIENGGAIQFHVLKHLWNSGVSAVSGQRAVAEALKQDGGFAATMVIAVGKAASSMFLGAQSSLSWRGRSIIVSKHQHIDPLCRTFPATEIIEAGHPVPDENSLLAGEAILAAIQSASADEQLLLLVSGGASALAEVLEPGLNLAELQQRNAVWLGAGMTISQINSNRSRISQIKGGKLLGHFRGKAARVYAISDVQGDDLAIIGAGIGDPALASAEVQARVIASNAVARNAVVHEARKLGLEVQLNEESLYMDVSLLANEMSNQLANGGAGIYIWGGEPTIKLPPEPGSGGRNQSLALEIAIRIQGTCGISVMVAGTDGTDGPTEFAGAVVDGCTVDDTEEAEIALKLADAGTYLAARQRLFKSGPTNTNVMDLVVAMVA